MAEVSATPQAVAHRDEGLLNVGINASDTTITVGAIYKYPSGVKTKQGFDSTSGFAEISLGGRTEIISFGAASVNATTKVTTLTDVRRGLSQTSTTQSLTAGTGVSFPKGAKIRVIDSANYIQATAFTDIANSFGATQTIGSTNKLQFNDSGTYIFDDGTDMRFKDSQNSETTLSTLAASGNDEKVGVDSGATPGYLGAANSDGVLRTGDGFSYTDGGDFVTLDLAKLKDSAGTELTISSGAVTHTNSFHTIDTESDAASDDLDTISGGAEGDYLTIMAANDGRTVVVKNGTGNILTVDGNDYSIDNDDKAIILRFDGTNWREISRNDVSTQYYNQVVYLGYSDSAGIGASSTAVNNFGTHTYSIPPNDLTNGVAYEVEGAIAITWAAGRVSAYLKLGSVELAKCRGLPSGPQTLIFKGVIRGTTSAGASAAVRSEITGMICDTGGTVGNGIAYGGDYQTDNVATNSSQTLQIGFEFESSDGSHNAVLKTLTIKKISTSTF